MDAAGSTIHIPSLRDGSIPVSLNHSWYGLLGDRSSKKRSLNRIASANTTALGRRRSTFFAASCGAENDQLLRDDFLRFWRRFSSVSTLAWAPIAA